MKKYRKIIIAILLLILIIIIFLIAKNNKKTIVGKWKAVNSKDDYYYIFNKDKTCSYEMTVARLDCTYEVSETEISILYKGNTKPTKFEYRFDGNKLIIKDDKGNDNEFTKQKEK